jgi:hypothetical protein
MPSSQAHAAQTESTHLHVSHCLPQVDTGPFEHSSGPASFAPLRDFLTQICHGKWCSDGLYCPSIEEAMGAVRTSLEGSRLRVKRSSTDCVVRKSWQCPQQYAIHLIASRCDHIRDFDERIAGCNNGAFGDHGALPPPRHIHTPSGPGDSNPTTGVAKLA